MQKNMKQILENFDHLPFMEDYEKEVGTNFDYKKVMISPAMIPDNDEVVYLSTEVTSEYSFLVNAIKKYKELNDYPFYILGTHRKLSGEEVIVLDKIISAGTMKNSPSLGGIKVDTNRLLNVLGEESHDIVVFGNIHQEKKHSLDQELSASYKEKYHIREECYNISLRELEDFKIENASALSYYKDAYHMTIMPNGEVLLLTEKENKLEKVKNIKGRKDFGEIVEIPVCQSDRQLEKNRKRR